MQRILLTFALLLAALPGIAQAQSRKPAHVFATQGDHFTLDGKPFKVLSGELHYARIPREYWHARLKMAKAMGLNTIATYVFWNVHEPSPGHYDFSANNDLAAFVRAAQQEGLYVILRSGPYACAEWDLGGLPAWLLADPKSAAAIRSNDPAFLVPAERWITRLSREVLPLQIGRGGPILMTQIENEYGQFGNDHAYIAALHDIYLKAGFNGKDSLLYTADNWRHIPEGSIPGLFASVNFGIKNHQGGMDALARARPTQALFVSEYWPGWFDHWGHPHETRPVAPQLEDIDYILTRGAGINIYMFHGGTSFGFMAGSSYINSKFLPDVTSYDYDAPLDESGRATPKYYAYRKLLAKYSKCGNESCLPPVPPSEAVLTIPTIAFAESAPLWDNLPKPVASALLAGMEHFGQNYGYILYRTQLPEPVHGNLILKDVHDFAAVYIDGKLIGTLDRRDATAEGSLPPVAVNTAGPARLDILVANDGRVNVDTTMRTETKGLAAMAILDGIPLSDWRIYPLPMTTLPTQYSRASASEARSPQGNGAKDGSISPQCGFAYGTTCGAMVQAHVNVAASAEPAAGQQPGGTALGPSVEAPLYSQLSLSRVLPEQPAPGVSFSRWPSPAFYRALFTLAKTGDTFLDTRNLGKGAVWINGHNLGRFWSVGPQDTFYVPGPWLKTGSNEIVVFDLLPNPHEAVAGLDHPILDGPVSDKTTSSQE